MFVLLLCNFCANVNIIFSISAVNLTNELGPLKVKNFLAKETTCVVDNLNSSMLYKFYLSAKTIKGSGPPLIEEAFTAKDISKLFR